MEESKARYRLKTVGRRGNVAQIENMLSLMKGELYKLLTNYMYISSENLNVYIDLTTDGEYILSIKASSDRLIDIGKIL